MRIQIHNHRVAIFILLLLLLAGRASGQEGDVRLTEVSEHNQWFEIKNTGNSSVDVSTMDLCANFVYPSVGDLSVRAYDASGNSDLTLAPGEYLALNWSQIDANDGDLGLYHSGTAIFSNSDNIVDYLRWGSDDSEANREDVAVDAGIWTQGDYVSSAQSGATIAFLGSDVSSNDDPADWGEGNPTPGSGNVVLPVELVNFEATKQGHNVVLSWQTASETNNSGFEVQHRRDGVFEAVSFLDGAGTTEQPQTYRHTVSNLTAGTHAFRLRQVDFDGSFEFSPEVTVEIRALHGSMSVPTPHPVRERGTIFVTLPEAQEVRLALFDLLGREVQTLVDAPLSQGRHPFTINGAELGPGTYVLRATSSDLNASRTVTVVR